jgi:sporulation protein YlmC with PRC-barrel domain
MQVLERYEIAKEYLHSSGYKSIKDWAITDANGKTIGNAEDLLVDLQTGKVRYILGRTSTDLEVSQRQPTFILPVGLVTLRNEDQTIQVKRIDPDWISRCPFSKEGAIPSKVELELARGFGLEKEMEELYEQACFRVPEGLCP